MSVVGSSKFTLVGGHALFLSAGRTDTALTVDYDSDFRLTLKNGSESTLHLPDSIEVGLLVNGEFQPSEFSPKQAAQISSRLLIPGESVTITVPQLTMTRRTEDDWTSPFAWRLSLDQGMSFTGSFAGSEESNRFKGIVFTSEASPDSLGILDAPAGGDWQTRNELGFALEPAYPNWAWGSTVLGFFLLKGADSVHIQILLTPSVVLTEKTIREPLEAGQYSYRLDLADLLGIYRIRVKVWLKDEIAEGLGDIWVRR